MTLDMLEPDIGVPHPIHQRQQVNEQVTVLDGLSVRRDEIIPQPFREVLSHA